MRRVAILSLALIGYLMAVGVAAAVMQGPIDIALPAFTKATHGAGNAVTATIAWAPVTFDPGGTPLPNSHTDVVATSTTGAPAEASVGPTTGSVPLLLTDGADYTIRVTACQKAGACDPNDTLGSLTDSDVTRIDADPPAGTLRIDGGAAFTNRRDVTLSLAATDPLINGIPGTSSGVTQYAVDQSGNGTYPCSILIINGPGGDRSGCARAMAPTGTATIPAGDGPHTVSVVYGDGARTPTAPCQGILCHVLLLGDPILGNLSAPASATIGLDTVPPTAVVQQSRFSVDRGGAVAFDSSGSLDGGTAPSGVDPAATTWHFADGTPLVTGVVAPTHLYARAGTYVGTLRVRDRAGNPSAPRSFAVTVLGPVGTTGGGSVAGISGSAGFTVSRLTVRARYARSRLQGSVALAGTAATAGRLRAEIRRQNGRLVRRIGLRALRAGAFARSVRLPATLTPGRYALALVGPGGTLRTTLRLVAPREGVARGVVRGRSARFVLAAQPLRSLRSALTVRFAQGGRTLATIGVRAGRTVRASLPAGTALRRGRLTATLRAGSIVVAVAGRSVR